MAKKAWENDFGTTLLWNMKSSHFIANAICRGGWPLSVLGAHARRSGDPSWCHRWRPAKAFPMWTECAEHCPSCSSLWAGHHHLEIHNTIQYNTTQHNIQYNTTQQKYTTQYWTMQNKIYHAKQHSTVQSNTTKFKHTHISLRFFVAQWTIATVECNEWQSSPEYGQGLKKKRSEKPNLRQVWGNKFAFFVGQHVAFTYTTWKPQRIKITEFCGTFCHRFLINCCLLKWYPKSFQFPLIRKRNFFHSATLTWVVVVFLFPKIIVQTAANSLYQGDQMEENMWKLWAFVFLKLDRQRTLSLVFAWCWKCAGVLQPLHWHAHVASVKGYYH